jgi:two-component system alkaline phosphatase synthesis response regulator PhoP
MGPMGHAVRARFGRYFPKRQGYGQETILMKVLVIDDEPDVLMLCRVNLELAGHEVVEASNGEDGLELVLAERPDAVVLDLMLPKLDGISVLENLARNEGTRDVPVILLTAKTQREDRRAAWRAGCTEYLTKPFSPVDLVSVAERAAEMSAADRSARRERELALLGG